MRLTPTLQPKAMTAAKNRLLGGRLGMCLGCQWVNVGKHIGEPGESIERGQHLL